MTNASEPDAFQLDVLRNLVALNTVNPPGNERIAAEYLAPILAGLGFAVAIQDIGSGRSNLTATLAGDDGPELVLCGHLDVVAANPSHWSGDPFVMRRRGDHLFGRGVCDMKGGVSGIVAAARDFVASHPRVRGRLTLLFVADEEVDGLGARSFVAGGGRPDMVIIAEPTGMDVCIATRGVVRYRIDVTGRSGHAARPREALNPIPVAAGLAQLISGHNAQLAATPHSLLPPASIAVTMFEAGEQPNTIPGHCRLTVDRRTLPHESAAVVAGEAEALCRRLPLPEGVRVGAPDIFIDVPAAGILPGSLFGERCRSILAAMGVDAAIRHFPAGCDQFIFAAAGIDCLLVGPGHIGQAHMADEYVEVGQLALAREFYYRFAKEHLT